MIFRGLLCAVLMAGMFAIGTEPVDAFYDDTHYAFTYYMARECGYTPLQAHRLASANVRVDDSVATEPVQAGLEVLSNRAQEPRVAFHAFRDARVFGRGQEALADAAIREQEEELWLMAKSMRNPGVLLHFIQDEPSHAGYASIGGHWFSIVAGAEAVLRGEEAGARRRAGIAPDNAASLAVLDTLADPTLPMGATTDFLSYRPDKTNLMVAKTVNALKLFMKEMSPRQRVRPNCTEGAMRSVTVSLMKANFVTPQLAQYAAGQLATPRLGDAHLVVGTAVSASGALPQYQYRTERIPYELGPSGQPTNVSPDDFTLYGTVATRLRRAGPDQRPVEVSVWAKPTRADEQRYQLNCTTMTGPGVGDGPILPGLLDNLPVGDLLVRAVTSSGKVIEQSVELKQLDQEVILDIPADEPEKATKCGEKVAERAKNMCTAVPGGGLLAKFQPNADKKFEDGFEDELEKAKECEEKEEKQEEDERVKQEQNSQPGNGPSAAKVIGVTAGLTGGAIAGAIAYSEYKKSMEAIEAAAPRSTPSSSSPAPTPSTSTASTVSLGGFTCSAANATSNLRTCTGSINVRAGTLIAARQGTTITALTAPSFFSGTFPAPGLGGTTGTVNMRATLSPSLCTTQVSLGFSIAGSNAAFETLRVSIPVNCP